MMTLDRIEQIDTWSWSRDNEPTVVARLTSFYDATADAMLEDTIRYKRIHDENYDFKYAKSSRNNHDDPYYDTLSEISAERALEVDNDMQFEFIQNVEYIKEQYNPSDGDLFLVNTPDGITFYIYFED